MSKLPVYLKSMTAYGRGMVVFTYGRLTVEIQSVNRRFLDINIALPRLLTRFEEKIRKAISSQVGRGMVNVSVEWRFESRQSRSILPNLSLARQLKDAWERLAYELGLEAKVDLALLAQEKEILIYEENLEDEEETLKALESALFEALDQLRAMKGKEGNFLAADLKTRVSLLQELVGGIGERAKDHAERYRQKLSQRLEELFSGSASNEERILREVAVYAERIDITEEIVRFKSHLIQFKELLEKPLEIETDTRGRTLDFLIQELNREINTIGSKVLDAEATQKVVLVKSELEKMREQIQNVE